MLIYGQHDVRWAHHFLGWGPKLGTIGEFGCYDCCFAMIVNDCKISPGITPANMDEIFTQMKIFVKDPTGTFDLLPDNALDQVYRGKFRTHSVNGFDAVGIAKAVVSPNIYALGHIETARVPTHFVIFWSKDGKYIADPETGKVNALANYGGPAAITKTIYVEVLPVAVPAPKPVPAPTPTPVVVVPPSPPQPVSVPTPLPVPSPVPAEVNAIGILQELLIFLIKTYLQLMGQTK